MTRYWWTIAKADYFAQHSKFHRRRMAFFGGLTFIGVVWALFIVPWIISLFIGLLGDRIESLLIGILPGMMRSVIFMFWFMVVVLPIPSALQEIKIGQWEIILSHNVSTRTLLMGTYMGKIPTYGLMVLFLAPILITPFAIIFHVSVLGQMIVYGMVFFLVISSTWVSNLLSMAIKAKLGESPRGNDIAKGLSIISTMGAAIIYFGIMFFAEPFATFLGLDMFLLFPFTWGADLITWTILWFSGVNLPTAVITMFETMLGFPALLNFLLLVAFSVSSVGIGLMTADRLFHFRIGARTENVTTVGSENIFLRGLRYITPGSFGILVVTSLKDFGRNVENRSRVAYSIVMAILLPVILNFTTDLSFLLIVFTVSLVLGAIYGTTFGGIGFLESADQLWIIKSAPKGVIKFVKARLAVAFLFAIPLAGIPAIVISIIVGLDSWKLLLLLGSTCAVVCGVVLVSTGITASNPTYKDKKNSAFGLNIGLTALIFIVTMVMSIFAADWVASWFENIVLMIFVYNSPLILIGVLVCFIGTRRLARPEKE